MGAEDRLKTWSSPVYYCKRKRKVKMGEAGNEANMLSYLAQRGVYMCILKFLTFCSVHFHPTLFIRPSFLIFRGSGSKTNYRYPCPQGAWMAENFFFIVLFYLLQHDLKQAGALCVQRLLSKIHNNNSPEDQQTEQTPNGT